MTEYLVRFLAEVGLSISISCLMLILFSKKGGKWTGGAIVFLLFMTTFYINQIPFVWAISAWLLLLPFGFLILFKNTKACSYYFVLNNLEENPDNKKEKKKELSTRLKKLDGYNTVLLTSLTGLLIVVFLNGNFAIFQVPLFIIGFSVLLGLSYFFFTSDKNSLNRKLNVNLLTFMVSLYFIMSYLFLNMLFYLYADFGFSLFYSSIFASVVIGGISLLMENELLRIQKAILVSEKNRSLAEIFSKYYKAMVIVSFLLILILSDTPLAYQTIVNEDIGMMLQWMGPFFMFLSFYSMKGLANYYKFQLDAGLLEKTNLENEFRKLC
jgi:hypothetical protein